MNSLEVMRLVATLREGELLTDNGMLFDTVGEATENVGLSIVLS